MTNEQHHDKRRIFQPESPERLRVSGLAMPTKRALPQMADQRICASELDNGDEHQPPVQGGKREVSHVPER